MTPISTTEERIKNDTTTNWADYAARDEWVNRHTAAEISELRTALEARLPQFHVTSAQLAIVRGAKREMVDRLIGAGLDYGICGLVSHFMEIMLQDLSDVVK